MAPIKLRLRFTFLRTKLHGIKSKYHDCLDKEVLLIIRKILNLRLLLARWKSSLRKLLYLRHNDCHIPFLCTPLPPILCFSVKIYLFYFNVHLCLLYFVLLYTFTFWRIALWSSIQGDLLKYVVNDDIDHITTLMANNSCLIYHVAFHLKHSNQMQDAFKSNLPWMKCKENLLPVISGRLRYMYVS
jgi:hypothetical protein